MEGKADRECGKAEVKYHDTRIDEAAAKIMHVLFGGDQLKERGAWKIFAPDGGDESQEILQYQQSQSNDCGNNRIRGER